MSIFVQDVPSRGFGTTGVIGGAKTEDKIVGRFWIRKGIWAIHNKEGGFDRVNMGLGRSDPISGTVVPNSLSLTFRAWGVALTASKLTPFLPSIALRDRQLRSFAHFTP
ncbi:hypothetical protein PIB30_057898 [Stylosanthes scabra]|uniref:Uncharacterized protein n=1 Tax=Stylosanthes scabra TaxID=79078 RepID=A0ABU6WI52_9FABA|nr:hypothetical protein [Stylosanthes scabra]